MGKQPDWAALRKAYCRNDCTVNQLCARFGVTRSRLYHQARLQAWPKRLPTRAGSAESGAAGGPGERFSLKATLSPGERLRLIIEHQLIVLQRTLSAPVRGGNAARRERDARIMSLLVRIYDKLLALSAREHNTLSRRNGDTPDREIARIDQRRDALARRLARLRERKTP